MAIPGTAARIARQSLEIVLDRVLAAHPAQDRIVAGLDRQVEVLADRRTIGHRRDQPVGQVPRVRRHEPEARDRRDAVGGPDGVDRPDELGQVRPAGQIELAARPALGVDVAEARLRRQVVAVRVDVLAEQRDLAIAGRGERARLGDDLVERPAALGPAAERDDAVGARLVAAVDDREPGADRRPAGDRAAGHGGRPRGRQMVGGARPTVRPTIVVAPAGAGRPIGAWAEASPSRSTSSGSSSGRRNRSTAG